MAEFGAGGAGLRDEDRRALKEGKKLLKKALGAAGMGGLLGKGKSKEKLRREKERRRAEEQARAAAETRARQNEIRARQNAARAAMVRRCAAAERAKADAARAEAATERAEASTARAEAEADSKRLAAERAADAAARAEAEAGLESDRAAVAMERAAAAAARAEAESDYKSLAAEEALSARATEDAEALRSAIEAERAASQARAQREAEAERRRQAVEEAAQRRERALREQIRTMERELEEHEGGGFADVCGLFGGVSGGVAARARGAALREAKQELERRRAELAVVVAQSADRERAFADELAAEREAREAVNTEAARYLARWYATSFELQTAEKHAQNTIDLKNLELREEVERSNAMKTELEYEAERKAAMDVELGQASLRERLAEAKLQDTVAELSRLKAELEQARSTAAPVGNEGELVADLDKLDRAVSSLLEKKNQLKSEVRETCRGMPINNNGHSIEYAMKAVEKDFENMSKMIREFRSRAEAQRPSAAASEEPLPVGTEVKLVGCAFNTSFNGRRGIIVEASQDLIDRGRVAVRLGGGATLPFSRKNVVKWSPEQAAGAPAYAFGASSPAPPAPAPAGGPAFTFGAALPPPAPPPPRAPQPAVVQQTTYYSSSPSPQIYIPRPAPTPPRRSSSGGARMGTVLRNDGMPDRRYASPRPVTTSGRPDRRFSVNRPATSSTRSSGSSSGRRSGGTRRK
ncbi:unnamed protein product [Pelagomonas calceolata]|uniref:Uncharacterized protein n=1 Tax=Pelagomonas calceolata TaxID=35677 RepID=A0A7S3ZVA3_9STRA|nr:unnamed protein product [Pelagomonas calceolata]